MTLKDTLLRERDNLSRQLAELDMTRSRIVREIGVLDESLSKLDEPGEENDGNPAQPKRRRRDNSGLERTRKLLMQHPEGLTSTEIAETLGLQPTHASNIISHLNNVEKVLVQKGKRGGKNVWALPTYITFTHHESAA